ncbi:spike base protein, RCAP_Rcc01079 family [Xanthobacter wiegelii]|uniref:spike base protein, RCAP_Rcc01079 family n=1 Tax=Xanthobacter wiegelii TaxID=3119913 RepID=UPI00372C8780
MNVNDLGRTNTALDLIPITPSDAANLAVPVCALWVQNAGNVRFVTAKGRELTLTVDAGWLPVAALKVFATNTTATGIYGVPA